MFVCVQDIKQFDMFQEWTDGYVRFIYSGETLKISISHLLAGARSSTTTTTTTTIIIVTVIVIASLRLSSVFQTFCM